MKLILTLIILVSYNLYAQNTPKKEYFVFIKKADSLYGVKQYFNSAMMFSKAFTENNGIGSVKDRYNAACSWSLAKNLDSAFFQLYRIATKGNFKDYLNLTNDDDLNILHTDIRWLPLLEIVKQNQITIGQ